MRRILFVDDEPRILDGLSRMLRGLRNEWEMVFAQGGCEALNSCASAPFDVVVSDARMPGMDGSELLKEIIRLYPDTVRIILSGQCSRDSVLKSVAVAHQFLSKPCDPRSLKAAVQKVCSMRASIHDTPARKAISCAQKLPSQAALYAQIADEVSSSAASIERVAEIIARDVAMCAKTLQLVSSGFFGTPQRVMDAAHAARLLGLETVKAVLDSSSAFAVGDSESSWEEDLRLLNDHSSAVAAVAKQIAKTVTSDRAVSGGQSVSHYGGQK
jgi:DNA-binding NarL/FixJ family response regulator